MTTYDWAIEAERLNLLISAVLSDSDKAKVAEFLRATYECGLDSDKSGLDPYAIRQQTAVK